MKYGGVSTDYHHSSKILWGHQGGAEGRRRAGHRTVPACHTAGSLLHGVTVMKWCVTGVMAWQHVLSQASCLCVPLVFIPVSFVHLLMCL